jgi:hypothetical protein
MPSTQHGKEREYEKKTWFENKAMPPLLFGAKIPNVRT